MRACRHRAAVAAALLLVAGAGRAAAHDVPIAPSTCAFGTMEVLPDGLSTFTAIAPSADDAFRIGWDAAANAGQFNLTDVEPRRLESAAGDGTLTLPVLFGAGLRASGDLDTAPLALLLLRQGLPPISINVALTTGLAGAGAALLEGAPVGADGSFVLVGRDDASAVTVRFGGRALPAPDLDQFTPVPRTLRVGGRIGTACPRGTCRPTGRLKATFVTATPLECAQPLALRVSLGGTTVATAHLPGGLAAQRRGCSGTTADGLRATVRRLGGRDEVRWALAVGPLVPHPGLDTLPPGGRIPVTFEVGGMIARATPTFVRRTSARGTKVRFRP